MITDWLLDAWAAVRGVVFGSVDTIVPDVPGWVASAPIGIGEVMGKAAALDAWVPVSSAGPILLFIPVAILAGLAIKLARIAASFIALGGGSAG